MPGLHQHLVFAKKIFHLGSRQRDQLIRGDKQIFACPIKRRAQQDRGERAAAWQFVFMHRMQGDQPVVQRLHPVARHQMIGGQQAARGLHRGTQPDPRRAHRRCFAARHPEPKHRRMPAGIATGTAQPGKIGHRHRQGVGAVAGNADRV